MIGGHCIKVWSKTQAPVAKSPAESELYAAVRGGCEALGILLLLKDLGQSVLLKLSIDAGAAKGILERQGLTNVRHLDVGMLWMQDQVARCVGLCAHDRCS